MRPLVIAFVIALVVGPLAVLAWRRPDPKHVFMLSLIERLPAESPQPAAPAISMDSKRPNHRSR